jgi:hypothetical protein
MKKIMGHVTGKLSLSILTVIVLLVAVLAGFSRITSTKASSKSTAANSASSSKDLAVAKSQVTRLPLLFEPNRGQTDSRVKYSARAAGGYAVYLTGPGSAVMSFKASEKYKMDVLSMNLAGSNPSAVAEPRLATGGVSNYYRGNDRSKWVEKVPNYRELAYKDVYSGIDVIYKGDNNRLRYDFVVKPGADPKTIRMAYGENKGVSIDANGNLLVAMEDGQLIGSKPVVYQEIAGTQRAVKGEYVLTAKNEVGFRVGEYDRSQALIIDPTTTFGTFVHGAVPPAPGVVANTQINGVAVDGTGVYSTGYTLANDFPTTTGGTYQGARDAFIMKLPQTLQGVAPIFSTYLGGPNDDSGNGIDVLAGSPVVVGTTNSGVNFPTQTPLQASGGANFNQHIFLTKLTSAGSQTAAGAFGTLL